jgi:hypothetical protein
VRASGPEKLILIKPLWHDRAPSISLSARKSISGIGKNWGLTLITHELGLTLIGERLLEAADEFR